ncbi:hypothetical protein BRARA_E02950, partial [Brassica rapa]
MRTVVVRFADADAAAAADADADYCSFRRRRKLRSTLTLPQEVDFWVVRLTDAAAIFRARRRDRERARRRDRERARRWVCVRDRERARSRWVCVRDRERARSRCVETERARDASRRRELEMRRRWRESSRCVYGGQERARVASMEESSCGCVVRNGDRERWSCVEMEIERDTRAASNFSQRCSS